MKTNKKFIIGVLGLSVALCIPVGYYMVKAYKKSKTDIAFDNSKPGLWKVKTTTTLPSDPQMNKEDVFEICIDQKMIDNSKVKPLEEKLDIKGLQCESVTKRVSNEVGEFSFNCSGKNPENEKNIKAKISGNIDSKVESGGLEINYELANGVDAPFKFQMKTESSRVGECKPKEQLPSQPQH